MTIPSELEFDQALKLHEQFDTLELATNYWSVSDSGENSPISELGHLSERAVLHYHIESGAFLLKPNENEIREFVIEMAVLFREKTKKILELPAMTWLEAQPAYSAAFNSLYSKNKFDMRKAIDDHVDSLIKVTTKFSEDINHEKNIEALEKKVKRLIKRKYGAFTYGILSAFKRYFYNDIGNYLELEKQAKSVAKKARKSLDKLVEIEMALATFNETNRGAGRLSSDHLLKLLQRTSIELKDVEEGFNIKYRPIEKNDARAKERLLIFCLWRHFNSYFDNSGNKSTAITHLLCVEGVENQITQRAVDALIHRWSNTQESDDGDHRAPSKEYLIEKEELIDSLDLRLDF